MATLRENGTRILAVALVILVVFIGGFMIYSNKKNATYAAWDRLSQLSQTEQAKPEAASAIAQQSSDPVVSAWAMKMWGDALAEQAMAGAPEKLAAGLKESQAAYAQAEKAMPSNTLLVASAQMGRAMAAEGLGQWDEAKTLYEEVSKNRNLVGTGVADVAAGRLSSLDQRRAAAATFTLASATTKSAPAANEKVAK